MTDLAARLANDEIVIRRRRRGRIVTETVVCYRLGALAVHRIAGDDTFRVSHISTGLKIAGSWDDPKEAIACMQALAALTDWAALDTTQNLSDLGLRVQGVAQAFGARVAVPPHEDIAKVTKARRELINGYGVRK